MSYWWLDCSLTIEDLRLDGGDLSSRGLWMDRCAHGSNSQGMSHHVSAHRSAGGPFFEPRCFGLRSGSDAAFKELDSLPKANFFRDFGTRRDNTSGFRPFVSQGQWHSKSAYSCSSHRTYLLRTTWHEGRGGGAWASVRIKDEMTIFVWTVGERNIILHCYSDVRNCTAASITWCAAPEQPPKQGNSCVMFLQTCSERRRNLPQQLKVRASKTKLFQLERLYVKNLLLQLDCSHPII